MGVQKIRRAGALLAMGALVAFVALPGVSYAGQPKDGSSKTEDNDSNDGNTSNNVSDDGDNKHPSGKDRSVENGKSGNQGNSKSDPDDDGHGPDRSNGGPDKADGSGGMDKADQDGNNGCGNDDDFEDDNEGWCGKHPKKDAKDVVDKTKKTDRCKKEMNHGKADHKRKTCDYKAPSTTDDEDAASTFLDAEESDAEPEVATEGSVPDDSTVLGAVVSKPKGNEGNAIAPAVAGRDETLGGALPFTGASMFVFMIVAMGLVITGVILMKSRRANG
jgi:hypothetical protein